jgi:threonine/homoserine/homoserine lactone efflux protein
MGLISAYLSTFALTLTNPMTILSFIAVFAGLGLGADPTYSAATTLVLGVFAGSTLWWAALSTLVGALRTRINERTIRLINRISGGLIVALGIYSLLQVENTR